MASEEYRVVSKREGYPERIGRRPSISEVRITLKAIREWHPADEVHIEKRQVGGPWERVEEKSDD